MKIALAQLNYITGDFEGNKNSIIQNIRRAEKENADLVVFSELCICGYPPLDLLESDEFIGECIESIEEIALECKKITAIIGGPSINPRVEGKNLFNSAFFLSEGRIKSIINKTLLPNYDVFDEYRYFEPNNIFHCIELNGQCFALTICEDLWDIGDDKMYVKWPMEELKKYKPEFIINIAASPFSYNHQEKRKNVLCTTAAKYNLPVFYVNHIGGQTELIFDGGSMVVNHRGDLVNELSYFTEDFRVFDAELIKTAPAISLKNQLIPDETIYVERIYHALILGIRDYFRKMGLSNAILGLSGGIDSAVVYTLAADALGPDRVLGLIMPSPYSSQHSITDSLELAANIGAETEIIPIETLFSQFKQSLDPIFKGAPENIAEENIQARIRALLLMAISNKKGHILLNTSNKSEAAVGYGTLYGDMAGGLSVIGDLYKTQVYELAEFMNIEKKRIPDNIISKAPSAELRPGQKDSDSLPDYTVLDKILLEYIENNKTIIQLKNSGYDEGVVRWIFSLVHKNEYKRHQLPPVLRISNKSFGMGRRMPIVAKY